jgi:hypothetical protein
VENRIRILNQLIGLLMSLYLCWWMIPDHKRRAWMMSLSLRLRQASLSLAHASAQMGMSRELQSDPGADINYAVSYQVMTQLYDRAVAWYERLRNVSA